MHRHHRLGHMAGHNWQPETLRVAVLFDFSCSNLDTARADPPQENMWRDCKLGTSQPLRLLRKTCRALTIRLWLLRTGAPVFFAHRGDRVLRTGALRTEASGCCAQGRLAGGTSHMFP